MAVTHITETLDHTTHFQNCVERMLTYWNEHDAVKTIDVTVLDRERNRILKNITLGLDIKPLWSIVKKLVIAFAPYMERRGFWDVWHGVLEQAIRMAQRANDVEAETTLTAFMARLCQRMSRPEDVARYYRRVIRLARQSGNQFEEARACSNLGYLYIDGGHWWRSEVLSQHALAIFDELGSEHGRAHTHNHFGVLYIRQEEWSKAEYHLRCACQIWEETNDIHSLIYGYINLGSVYVEISDPDQALPALQKAYQYSQTTGELSTIAKIWNNMSISYRLQKDWENAKTFAQKAEERFREYLDHQQLAYVWNNLGLIMLGSGKTTQAIEYLEMSLNMHQTVNNHLGIRGVQADLRVARDSIEE